ncbi:hypothetical protein OV450_7278 [Actinobacteria bacterium OV450]|nr:hypothetical protein OV450_7278 [Actinobacteria bacterium OV450]
MTAFTEPQHNNWMDRDNAVLRRWSSRGEQPVWETDPLPRLLGFRTDGVRGAEVGARQRQRTLKVVRYVQTPTFEAAAQFEALELVACARHWRVRREPCLDLDGPALLEHRPGLSAAKRLIRAGFADGLLAPRYEHISPNLREYERFLKDMADHGWFVALALPETSR